MRTSLGKTLSTARSSLAWKVESIQKLSICVCVRQNERLASVKHILAYQQLTVFQARLCVSVSRVAVTNHHALTDFRQHKYVF